MRYEKKLDKRILNPRHVGFFSPEEAIARQMHRAEGRGEGLLLTFLVDPEDGLVVDARFRVFGPAVLIGLAETACELSIQKSWDQVARIGADLIESHLSPSKVPGFLVNRLLDVLEEAMAGCQEIPLPPDYVSPLPHDIEMTAGYPGFEELTKEQKRTVIEEVIKNDIRPYIELDGGGIEIVDILGDEVIIAYEGSCTTCHSSTGATLSYIQQWLQAKVFRGLLVIPQLDNLMPE